MISRAGRSGRRGAAIAQTVMVGAVFLMVLFGLIEYGRFVLLQNHLGDAAREGARYAAVHTADKTDRDVEAHVRAFLGNQVGSLDKLKIEVRRIDPATGNRLPGSWNDSQFGEGIVVHISGEFQPTLPLLFQLPQLRDLQAEAMMCSEAN